MVSYKSNSSVGQPHLKVSPTKQNLPEKNENPQIKKGFTALPALRKLPPMVYFQDGQKTRPILQATQSETKFNLTSLLKDTFNSVNKTLSDACELALKQLLLENKSS